MRIVLVTGRRDSPVDAVATYAEHLGAALCRKGVQAGQTRIDWPVLGPGGLRRLLADEAGGWRGAWVILQYTALQWSRRGFALRALAVADAALRGGARLAVTFHDVAPYGLSAHAGPWRRAVQAVRAGVQFAVMRRLMGRAHAGFVAVAPAALRWPRGAAGLYLVPVGSNVPPPAQAVPRERAVAVFAFSGGAAGDAEAVTIAAAVRAAAREQPGLVLRTFGRNAEAAAPVLRAALAGSPVTLESHGVVAADAAGALLASSSAALFVRGQATAGRGSAVAAIACGTPLVGYAGPLTGPPLTDAGFVGVPPGDAGRLAEALTRVLCDPALAADLARRNATARAGHFDWDAIAARYLEALDG